MSVVVAANEIVSHFGKTFHQVRENPVNHLLSMVCKKMQVWSRALPMEQFGKRPKHCFRFLFHMELIARCKPTSPGNHPGRNRRSSLWLCCRACGGDHRLRSVIHHQAKNVRTGIMAYGIE